MPASTTTENVFDAECIDAILTKLIEHENDESVLSATEVEELRRFDACLARYDASYKEEFYSSIC